MIRFLLCVTALGCASAPPVQAEEQPENDIDAVAVLNEMLSDLDIPIENFEGVYGGEVSGQAYIARIGFDLFDVGVTARGVILDTTTGDARIDELEIRDPSSGHGAITLDQGRLNLVDLADLLDGEAFPSCERDGLAVRAAQHRMRADGVTISASPNLRPEGATPEVFRTSTAQITIAMDPVRDGASRSCRMTIGAEMMDLEQVSMANDRLEIERARLSIDLAGETQGTPMPDSSSRAGVALESISLATAEEGPVFTLGEIRMAAQAGLSYPGILDSLADGTAFDRLIRETDLATSLEINGVDLDLDRFMPASFPVRDAIHGNARVRIQAQEGLHDLFIDIDLPDFLEMQVNSSLAPGRLDGSAFTTLMSSQIGATRIDAKGAPFMEIVAIALGSPLSDRLSVVSDSFADQLPVGSDIVRDMTGGTREWIAAIEEGLSASFAITPDRPINVAAQLGRYALNPDATAESIGLCADHGSSPSCRATSSNDGSAE